MKVFVGIFFALLLLGAIVGGSTNSDGGSSSSTSTDGVTVDNADTYCYRSSDDTGAIRSSEVCVDKATGHISDTTTGESGEDNSDIYGSK